MRREISDPEQAPHVAGLPKRVREAPITLPTAGVGARSTATRNRPDQKHPRLPEVPKASFFSSRMLLKGPPAALAVLSCIAAGEFNPFVWVLMYVIYLVPWGAFLLALALWLDFLAHPDRVTGLRSR